MSRAYSNLPMATPRPPSFSAGRPRRLRPDWWLFVVVFLLVVQVSLYLVPHIWPGPGGLLCWLIGGDRLLWLIVAGGMFVIASVWSLWKQPYFNRWRAMGLVAIVAMIAGSFMFRVYPSSFDDKPSEVRFRLPLDGPILVGWGGATPDVNYHVASPDQRWAYDLLVAKDGKTHSGDGTRHEDYYCYGLPVLAPADGQVVAVLDGQPDQPIGVMGGEPAGGNQLVVEVAPGQFLFLCHLQRGTIAVKEGDRVTQSQLLAKVGNSGNTSEPHLHIHLQSTPRLDIGEGIPLYFHNYRVDNRLVDRGIPTGGFSWDGPKGQVIEHQVP
jgi:hypothetical protein